MPINVIIITLSYGQSNNTSICQYLEERIFLFCFFGALDTIIALWRLRQLLGRVPVLLEGHNDVIQFM